MLCACDVCSKVQQTFERVHVHIELNDDDGDKDLYGHCPEIVRVDNCVKWHAMSTVSRHFTRLDQPDPSSQNHF